MSTTGQAPSVSTESIDQSQAGPSAQEMTAPLECESCCNEVNLDQIVSCSSQHSHTFCHICMRSYVDSQIGDARYRPVCFAMGSDCGAPIGNDQLRQCLISSTLDLLLDRQLLEDLKTLGLHLQECPFCDYVEEIDVDCECQIFACRKPSCLKVSCTECQREDHRPRTCEEAQMAGSAKQLDLRHELEEAMTNALMRQCNRCKIPFIKLDGCNKIVCAVCRNAQCYICGEDVEDYSHFDRECRLSDKDGVDFRHMNEVQAAKDEAIAKITQENPQVSREELDIQLDDPVAAAASKRLELLEEARQNLGAVQEAAEAQMGLFRGLNADGRRLWLRRVEQQPQDPQVAVGVGPRLRAAHAQYRRGGQPADVLGARADPFLNQAGGAPQRALNPGRPLVPWRVLQERFGQLGGHARRRARNEARGALGGGPQPPNNQEPPPDPPGG